MEILDTIVTIKDRFFITSPYSKPTNSKQYLVPSSVHKPSVIENIPKTVGMRLRRLCSDRVERDKIFADSLDEYRAYMEARGYDSRSIQGHFTEIANMRRKDSSKKVERRNKQWKDRPNSSSSIKNQYFQILTSQSENICEFCNIIKN